VNPQALQAYRNFLKDYIRQTIDFRNTHQSQGVPPPPLQNPCPQGAQRIALPRGEGWPSVRQTDLVEAINGRRSHRRFQQRKISLEELSFLLWATQGIVDLLDSGTAFRTVPSAGCRHALESYLCAVHVDGLAEGVYRYLPLEHELCCVRRTDHLKRELVEGTLGQAFVGTAPVTFVWAAVPYRMEWRYDLAAHKVIAMDVGHVCQNLYLACSAIGAGTCAVAAYHQELMDQLVGVDGKDEFVLYLAPVGKIERE